MKGWHLLVGSVIAVIGGVLLTRKAEAAEESDMASIAVAFSPTESVEEGGSVSMAVVVTNASTQSGAPVAASLTTTVEIKTTDGTEVLALQTNIDVVAADGSKTYSSTVTAPVGKSGQNLIGTAKVYSPDNVLLQSKTVEMPITAAAIVYGATISIS
jgi:CMP-2-keto-3-deoxyoctulosonic acid synthetase